MIRCLRDQTLFLLYDGDGTSAQRTHLTECETCATRYRQLGHDLETISRALREQPPRKIAGVGFHSVALRRASTAVALALVLVMIWQGARIWSPSTSGRANGTSNQEIWSLLQEFTADNFLLNEANAAELWFELAAPSGLAVAPDEGWPPDWYDLSVKGDVEIFTE